jgi:hypothetical protein
MLLQQNGINGGHSGWREMADRQKASYLSYISEVIGGRSIVCPYNSRLPFTYSDPLNLHRSEAIDT